VYPEGGTGRGTERPASSRTAGKRGGGKMLKKKGDRAEKSVSTVRVKKRADGGKKG